MTRRSPGGTEEPGGGERCPSDVSASAAADWSLAGSRARGVPPAEDPDRELVARWKAGDPGAFEELVRRHESRVYRFLMRMLGDAAEAEDVAQETFLRVYKFAGRYRPESPFTTWLYRIATNLSIEELRRRKRWARLAAFGKLTGAGFGTGGGDGTVVPKIQEDLIRQELTAKVRAAIHTLPPKYRFPVVLRDIQGLSYQEVADVTQLPLNTVRTRLNRGRLMLKEKLRPYLEESGRIRGSDHEA